MECINDNHYFNILDERWEEKEIDLIEKCRVCKVIRKTHLEWDGIEDYRGSFSKCNNHMWSTMIRSVTYGGEEKEYRFESMCNVCGCVWFRHFTPIYHKFIKS